MGRIAGALVAHDRFSSNGPFHGRGFKPICQTISKNRAASVWVASDRRVGTGSAPKTRSRTSVLSTSTGSTGRAVCRRVVVAAGNGYVTASGLRRSSCGRDGDLLHLSYRVPQHGRDWHEIAQSAPIVWMPCSFGGARPYLVCPGVINGIACGHRVAKLYCARTYFLCRHCYRLACASQREDRYDRALRRTNNIRVRLGGEPGMVSILPDRPKGMHKRTYERMQSKILDAEMLANERLAIFVERLMRSDGRIAARSRKEFWT